MATVDELYTDVDAKTASKRVVIENQPVGEVLAVTWSFAIGRVPTAQITVPFPAPAIAEYFADVYIDAGFNGVMARVFTGKVLNVTNTERHSTIECAGLSMFLERPSSDVSISINNITNLVALDTVFAAAGIDYYTLALPSWTMGTNNPTDLTFQTFAEAVTKIAEIDGGRWAEMPNGQIRVAVYDPLPAASVNRTYFSMNLTALAESYPSDLTSADGRPRIRKIRRTPKVQETKNRIHVRAATVTEEIAPGVDASHEIEFTQLAPSIYVLAPDGSQAYNDLVFSNDLIDTFTKAEEVALRLLAVHNRLKIPLTLTVDGDPLRQLGETVRAEDEAYAGLTDRWFVESIKTTLSQTDFVTQLKSIGGVGALTDLDPVAVFTWKAVWLVIDDDLYVMVTFDGRGSWDPDGTIASYSWSDNQAPVEASGSTSIISVCKKTFGSTGDIVPFWDVTLTVTDDDGNTASVTQTIDPTLCDTPVNPNAPAPTIFAALENNYSASIDAGQTWYDQAGTDVISVAADPVDPVRAAYGRDDGSIYWTDDGLFTAPAVALAAVGSPIVSMTWDDVDLTVVWAVSQDGRVYRSSDYGENFTLYVNLRTTLAHPLMRAGKVMAVGAALLVFGGDGAGTPVIALDQFKSNVWTKANIGGELLTDIASAPADLYIRDAAFNAGTQLWECAIIMNSATFTPSVFYTTDLRGDGSEWKRCAGLPAKSRGMWIAADLTPNQFAFAYNDNAVYLGDVS